MSRTGGPGRPASDASVVLCVNAGSSTLKVAVFEVATSRVGPGEGGVASAGAPGDGHERELWRWAEDRLDVDAAMAAMAAAGLPPPEAVGHRVVHGGRGHTQPALIGERVLGELRDLVPLAPLHQPAAIVGIEATQRLLPGLPQVACFDTAFHHTMPEVAARLPLPARFWDEGVRRYGFHGLSYEYVVDRVGAERLGRSVIAHLGNGASMCAVAGGRSVDTTMGFTPTGGIVMSTRSGDLDPGVLVHLLVERGVDVHALDHLVTRESGMLGLSGRSSDMRELLAARATGDAAAGLAVEAFCRSVRKQVGAYAAALGGLDTLVFTAGIGERSAEVRQEVVEGLGFLGVEIDLVRNAAVAPRAGGGGPDVEVVSPEGAPVTVLVVGTHEDRMIARHAASMLRSGALSTE